jgi:CBS domain-containing protein
MQRGADSEGAAIGARVIALPTTARDVDASRQSVTFLAEEGWTSEVSFYCPVRDRALSADECIACRQCRGGGRDPAADVAGCADPAARRLAGEDMLRAPRPRSLADRTPVWRVMQPCVICVRADLGIDTLMSLLVGFALRAVPVVDQSGRPVGVVSRSDLVEHWYESDTATATRLRASGRGATRGECLVAGSHAVPPAQTVGDAMVRIPFTLCEDTSLSHAAALMAYEGVERIPVVSFEGKVVGIVTAMDAVRWLAQHDGYVVPDSRSRGS